MKNSKVEDLKMMLNAIKITRARWMDLIDSKARELMLEKPRLTFEVAQHKVLLDKEVFEDYKNLLTLYGIVGDGSAAYLSVLEEIAPAEQKQVPLKRVA